MKLEQQFNELIEAKKKHEEELLAKCVMVLNEKKLKIRELMRVLACAKVDGKVAMKVRDAREVTKVHLAEASRKGKRKADIKEEYDEDGDDEFETSKGVRKESAEDADTDADGQEQMETPDAEAEEDVTADEESDDDDLGNVTRKRDAESPPRMRHDSPEGEKMQVDNMPPSRVLPFGKTEGQPEKESIAVSRSTLDHEAGNLDEETDDDDDDEL